MRIVYCHVSQLRFGHFMSRSWPRSLRLTLMRRGTEGSRRLSRIGGGQISNRLYFPRATVWLPLSTMATQVVQFSHFSVQEFLTSDRLSRSSGEISQYHTPLSPAHTVLAQACLGVLLRLDEEVRWYNASDIPLARYAARYWVNHAQFEDVSSHTRCGGIFLRRGQASLGSMTPCLRHRRHILDELHPRSSDFWRAPIILRRSVWVLQHGKTALCQES